MNLLDRLPYQHRLSALDYARALRRGRLGIQLRLRRHLARQRREWKGGYTHGYFYQGLEALAITGAKPTEFRFDQYQVDDLLHDADVLDIGSNAGFVAIYCAGLAQHVTAVEINPHLNRIARDAAAYLGVENISVIDADFSTYDAGDRRFDVVLSLSNHHTIDGNLHLPFEAYIRKIADSLRPGGYLLFESHNVFAEGKGGVGDDGDMEIKFAIMNRYFEIERYRMVRCFLKHAVEDLDKLFIVARRTENPRPAAFSLPEARECYEFVWL